MRDQLVAAARHLAARGLSPGSSGNLSVRDGDALLITPTGSASSRVQPGELSLLGLDGEHRSGPRPTKEAAVHLAAYHADPTARAVIHLHAPESTAIACLPARPDGTAELPVHTAYHVMNLGEVPLLPYAPPGDPALAGPVHEAVLGGSRVLLMARHGSLVVAGDLDRAVDLTEELEAACRLALALAGRGAPELAPDQARRLRRR